jgi:hypothetical protein
MDSEYPTNPDCPTLSFDVTFARKDGRKQAVSGKPPRPKKPSPLTPPEHPSRTAIPYKTRLLALAYLFDDMIRRGVVKDYAEIARMGGVSRARISQIMDLTLLPVTVQEDMLHNKWLVHG